MKQYLVINVPTSKYDIKAKREYCNIFFRLFTYLQIVQFLKESGYSRIKIYYDIISADPISHNKILSKTFLLKN